MTDIEQRWLQNPETGQVSLQFRTKPNLGDLTVEKWNSVPLVIVGNEPPIDAIFLGACKNCGFGTFKYKEGSSGVASLFTVKCFRPDCMNYDNPTEMVMIDEIPDWVVLGI